jgi:histidinol-phosphate aminotransferase
MFKSKESVKDLIPYKPSEVSCKYKLDANESKNYLFKDGLLIKNLDINLYPDTNSIELRNSIANYIQMKLENIVVGNGSSEMIELILKTFIEKNDNVLGFEPSFGMYKIYSEIYDAKYISIPKKPNFVMDKDQMISYANRYNPKVIFLCSPNNPTGLTISIKDITEILKNTKSLVVLDQAYIEFADENNNEALNLLDEFENLIILRTMSKAFGLAGLRLGYLISNQEIVDEIYRIKSPYNLNALSQYLGVLALKDVDKVKKYVNDIKENRALLYQDLKDLKINAFFSQANFCFFQSDIKDLHQKLIDKDILVRSFKNELDGYYRVTVGTNTENKYFIKSLKEIIDENSINSKNNK